MQCFFYKIASQLAANLTKGLLFWALLKRDSNNRCYLINFPQCPELHSFATSVNGCFLKLLNLLTTDVPYHTETSQWICIANQLTRFYMMRNIGR